MIVEVRVSSAFIPDGLSPRLERPAVLVRLTDCTEPLMRAHDSTPTSGQVVMKSEFVVMNVDLAGNRTPQPDIRNGELSADVGVWHPIRQGAKSPPRRFREAGKSTRSDFTA